MVVSGGTLPYTYNWISNGNSIGTNPTVTNLCAGTYTLQISDANNCATPNIPVALTEPSLVEDSIHIIDPYCANGAGGTLDLTVWGGVPPYSYSWSNSAVTEDIAGLANGNYSVTIFDAAGCGTVDSATFTSLPALSVTITATLHNGYHFKCNGGTDGEVVVDVTGGMPPYSYQWNDSLQSTVDSIYGLPAGNYTVTVTDAGGCVYLDSISLNLIPPVFDASITSLNPTCSGAANGSVTAVPVGGTTPYTYYWNYDTTLLNIPLTNIDTGQYILIIFDGTFCLVLDTVILTEPAPVTSSYTQVDVTCNGGTDGSIDYTVNGGTLPFTYSWNGGTYTTEDIASLTAGQYIIVALDSNLCPVSDTVQITEPPALQTQITSVNETCFGGSNASIDLTLLTGATPFTFNWNSGQYSIEDPQNILAGNYSVVVTDNNSCTVSASVTITEPTLITGNRQVTICATDSFFVGGAYQNTAGIYTDNLTAANGCDSILTTDLSTINVFNTQFTKTVCYGEQFIFNGVTYNASGNYLDTLTSTGGCDSVVSLTLNVLPDIDLSATPNHATIIAGDSVGVAVQSNSGTYIPNYTWTPQLNISCLDTACSQVLLFPQANTQYTVVAIDSNGCRDAVVVPIFVNGTPIFIPNVFTPNSDGANDFFEIYGNLKLLRYLEIQVFNRWGEKVFESNNFHFKWDGTYKGVAQTPSVFVWVLKLGFTDSPVEQIRKGSVTLMK